MSSTDTIKLERDYPAGPELIWRLWTTADGIESWWAPDGFTVRVDELDLRSGGELVYTMTATGPEQIAFMEGAGLPLATQSRKTFTEVEPLSRLSYSTVADFIPDVAPYEFLTRVELRRTESGTAVTMTVDAMHDEEWTHRLLAGRQNELDNLAVAIEKYQRSR